jgi:NTP pyrophosphatase (non-canonical NTP hydrolase)
MVVMEFQKIIERAMQIRQQCAAFEKESYGAVWTNEELALGFVGDVGDLAKLVVAMEGKRNIPDTEEKLAHELADCLWSVIALANAHNIDLEQAFLGTMDSLEKHIRISMKE